MELSKEEVSFWRQDRVTAEILSRLQREMDESLMHLADGTTMGATADYTAQQTAHAVGYLKGLRYLLDIEGDDLETGEKGKER